MKESLRKRLLSEINNIDERVEYLRGSIIDYKKDNDFESAMKCDIRYRQLAMVSQNLKKLLV